MVKQQHITADRKYVAGVFLRTGAVAAIWFGLTGAMLNAMSDRVSLQCERNEESIPECKASIQSWLTETPIKIPTGELKEVTNRAIANTYFPNFVEWEMAIVSTQGQIKFNSAGVSGVNHWEDFTDRTNRFIATPELRTFSIRSEYSFWFKFLSQSVSGISIVCALFLIPGLYLTAKYRDDDRAQQAALDRLFGQFLEVKSVPVTSDTLTENSRIDD